ncbi:hypothetical protein [Aliikangiella sp. IMCC44359]|uniref:hypothetical protein n=1 Tax=Aliikangiella sp. IMCC44359 TaxID=3459125 RepID=UPI00403A9BF4
MPFIATKKNPSGPDLVNLEHHEVNLSGTTIRFDAPYHNHYSAPELNYRKTQINLYDKSRLAGVSGRSLSKIRAVYIRDKWWGHRKSRLFGRFPSLGRTQFFVCAIHFPQFKNLFRPRRLEASIEAYVYDECSNTRSPSRRDYELLNLNGVDWAHFKAYEDKDLDQVDYFYATPVTDEHLLMVSFHNTVYEDNTKVPQLHSELADLIMSSFQVELSEDAKAQQAKAQQNYPYEKLSPTLPPCSFEIRFVETEFECMKRIIGEHPEYDDLPDEEFHQICQADIAEQEKKRGAFKESIRQGIIDKFKQLEVEDYQRYMAGQKATD